MALNLPGNLFGKSKLFDSSKVEIMAVNPAAFQSFRPDIADVIITGEGFFAETGSFNTQFAAPLNFPNGAEIISMILYGNAGAQSELYGLQRIPLATQGGGVVILQANIGTKISAISNPPVVDNETFSYAMATAQLATNDEVFGGSIEYIKP